MSFCCEVDGSYALLDTPFIRLWREGDVDGGVVRLCRTSERIETLEEAAHVWGTVAGALRRVDRNRDVLLIDFRDARGRNDAAFEQTVAPFRCETTRGFRKVAVLTRSLAGQLQVQRLAREDGVEMLRCFDSEFEALQWLHEGSGH
jgi:hypothetical protein